MRASGRRSTSALCRLENSFMFLVTRVGGLLRPLSVWYLGSFLGCVFQPQDYVDTTGYAPGKVRHWAGNGMNLANAGFCLLMLHLFVEEKC